MNTSKKIKTLQELSDIVHDLKERERLSVGLITGCFDVLHYQHVDYFEFAKRHVDVLVVGLDNDESIRRSKDDLRPVFSQNNRLKMISSLQVVDYVFLIEHVYSFGSSPETHSVFEGMIRLLNPTHWIISSLNPNWQAQQQLAERCGLQFILQDRAPEISSSKIIQVLESLG